MEAVVSIPWWFTFIQSLLIRFENIQSLAQISEGGEVPPRDIWMDNDALDDWKKTYIKQPGQDPDIEEMLQDG